jgi:hypothetical protein
MDVILAKMLATATATEYVLALATLGDATRNRNNPIYVAQPKVAKARTMVSVTCRCHQCYCDKLCQCKHSLGPTLVAKLVESSTNNLQFKGWVCKFYTNVFSYEFLILSYKLWACFALTYSLYK